MIRLLVGDHELREQSISVDSLSLNKLRAKQLVGGRFLIDLDAGRFDIRKLRALLKECRVDIDLRTNSFDKLQKVRPLVDKVVDNGATRTLNFFVLLRSIFSDNDRESVYRKLVEANPPLEVLLKWMMGNVEEDDNENMELLNVIDKYLYFVDKRIIYLLISHFDPIYPWRMRFHFRFKKKGE